jgi:hypothetical protein
VYRGCKCAGLMGWSLSRQVWDEEVELTKTAVAHINRLKPK